MNHLDSLTPTLVLVAGAIINHVYKEKKELAMSDVMLILSPTIPTLIPVLVSMLKTAVAAAMAPKTGDAAAAAAGTSSAAAANAGGGDGIGYQVWCAVLAAWLQLADVLRSLGLMSAATAETIPENRNEENYWVEPVLQRCTVKTTCEFMTQLVWYLNATRGDTCTFDKKGDPHYDILGATKISWGQVWSNIRIRIPLVEAVASSADKQQHIEIELDNLEVELQLQPDGELVVVGGESVVEEEREVDLTKITRLSDFIEDAAERKRFQALMTESMEQTYLNLVYKTANSIGNTARVSFSVHSATSLGLAYRGCYDIMMMILIKEKCPNLSIEKSVFDSAIMTCISVNGWTGLRSQWLGNSLSSTIDLFGYKMELDFTKNNVWGCNVGSYYNGTPSLANIMYEYSSTVKEKFTLAESEFPTIWALAKRLTQTQNDGAKATPPPPPAPTHLTFTLPTPAVCPAITASFQAFMQSIQQGKYTTTANQLLLTTGGGSSRSASAAKIKIYNMAIERKEVRTETPNPAYAEYEEKREQLSKLEKSEQTQFLTAEFMRQSIPPKVLVETKLTPAVATKLVNEKSKQFDTLYLRELDMRKLHNILTKFKSSTELFETYGLPNKLGILLHGEPGTGKTSTIHAVATFLQKNIYYTNLSNVETNEELQMLFDHVQLCSTGGGIIVFEDIDAMTHIVHRREPAATSRSVSGTSTPETQISRWSAGSSSGSGSENSLLTLEYLLNLMQGSLTRDGTIFIATTNHKEKLDPALCRVGRFDVDIEMKKCDHYQIQTIYKVFLQRPVPAALLRRIPEDQYTPAEFIFQCVQFIKMDDVSDETILAPFLEEPGADNGKL